MYDKLLIRFDLEVKTGLHIGDSSAFSAIGAVDSPVVRDAYTHLPVLPGSSLKGKIRTLLARSAARDITKMPDCSNDDPGILRLFGTAGTADRPPRCSRLQFSDSFLSNAEELKEIGVTEVKAENAIDRRTSVANPRQIERVIAGAVFAVRLVYDVVDEQEMMEDMRLLAKGLKLLQWDYLGGHGSRGSGRVGLKNFQIESYTGTIKTDEIKPVFAKVTYDELFPV